MPGNEERPFESGLYYLVNRYYNPLVSSFISRDSIDYLDPSKVSGLNLYTYCGYHPVNRVEPCGNFGIGVLIKIGLIALGVVAKINDISNCK